MGGVFERGAAPSGNVRGSFDGLDLRREQTRRIAPNQGRERERRKGGGRSLAVGSQRAGLSETLLAPGCVSHFTSSLAVAKAQRRGQEGGGRGRHPLSVCAFSQKRLN